MFLDHPAFQQHPGEAERRRGRRVMLLLAAVVMLSLGDLYATIAHATSVGMVELNPIGAYLIQSRSIAGLTLFKLGSIGITVLMIFHIRHHRSGELGGWVCLALLTLLSLHWVNYNGEVAQQMVSVDLRALAEQMALQTDKR